MTCLWTCSRSPRSNRQKPGFPTELLDLNVLARQVATNLSDRIQDQKTQVQFELSDGPLKIHADRSKLEQVLENLINNANQIYA